jgi:putative methyltransferase (TIGR04325 family)
MSGRFSASNLARLLLPPIIFKVFGKADWEYVADQWPKNDKRSFGWDDSSVVKNMRGNWGAYKDALESTAPLAFWPWSTAAPDFSAHNVLMTWGYVLARASYGKTRLSALDWGGALGNYAAAGKAILPEVRLEFTVKERPALCVAGRELLPDVSFTSSDDDCFSRRYDVVMASGSLQYAEDWRSMTRRLADAAQHWLFITNFPVARKSRSFVVVQRPQRHGLEADYISWVLNYGEFLEHVKSTGLILEREFLSTGVTVNPRNAPGSSEHVGFLFRRPRKPE